MTDEYNRALMEGHLISASDEWFKARQALDFPEMRRLYEAAYKRAWEDHAAQHPSQSAGVVLQGDRDDLAAERNHDSGMEP